MAAVYTLLTRRVHGTHLRTRRRVVLFLFVAFVLVLVPWMTLYVSEGIQSNKDALIMPGGQHDGDESKNGTDLEGTEGADRTSVVLVPSTPVSSSPEPEPTSVRRPDLPVRELSRYVNPLIGTEGRGHGIFFLLSLQKV